MPPSRDYSTGSGPTFTLRPRPSRLLLVWWWIVHGVGAAGIIELPLPWVLRCWLLAAVAGHGYRRFPRVSPAYLRYRNGIWAVPAVHGGRLRLAPGSRYSSWWIRLILEGRRGSIPVLVLYDQLEKHEWRALQAAIRRRPPRSDA